MSLPHIMLGQLKANKKMTGYDMTVRFKKAEGLFWTASHQQVYRELKKLEDQGFCTHVVEPQLGKPDRKVYTLTKAGVSELRAWQGTRDPETGHRDKLMAKVYSTSSGNKVAAISALKKEVEFTSKEIAKLEDINMEDMYNAISLDRRLSLLEWRRDWALKTIEKLK